MINCASPYSTGTFYGTIKVVILMIKFNEMKYIRPDYVAIEKILNSLITKLESSKTYENYLSSFKEIIKIQNHIEEMYDYADIKNMRDSNDKYFEQEIIFWNEYKSKFDLLFKPFYKICINSKFKKQLKEIVPENFFNTIEFQLKISSDKIIDLQKEENNLKTEYRKIIRDKITFNEKEANLAYVSGFFSNKNRNIRKQAHDTINDFYYKKQSELDSILFNLIIIRNKMANKLGFENYIVYSLYKLRRFDYDYTDIKNFRNGVIKHIIPLCKKLNNWKKQELDIENIKYFDTIYFKEMPKVLFKGQDLLNKFGETLKKINNDLYNIYIQMLENGYIDLKTKDNKVNFAITNYLTESAIPVITGNFKNSYLDLQTISHEFGHAYQKYNSGIRDKSYVVSSLLKYPTFEIAEMFSYAMELTCMKYSDNLFSKEDYKKYCFLKIYNLVSNMPYICLVDEFQEKIYSNKISKKEDIRKIWLELSKKYKFNENNHGHINLETGGYFYRQSHIILEPFYYIDYALSYFGAFAIFDNCTNDLNMFKNISSVASYYPFKKIIKKHNLSNPFDEVSINKLSKMLEQELLKYKIK